MQPRIRILYVDGHEDSRELMRAMLEPCCFEVVTSGTALEAIRLAQTSNFDLYILDTWLSDASGIDLCRRLSAVSAGTPVMFYSAAASEYERNEAMEAGAQCFAMKPASPCDMEETVVRLIKNARSERRLAQN